VTIGDPASVNSRWTGSPTTDFVSYPLYVDLQARNHVLAGLYANGSADDPDVVIGGDADATPEHPSARLVTGNYFSVLEIPPFAGRALTIDDDQPGAPHPVAMLSYAYWEHRFAKDRGVVGSIIRVNGVPVTVVGVTPPQFAGDIVGQPTDIWMPIALQPVLRPRSNYLNRRDVSWLVMMGRLAANVPIARARAELPVIEAQVIRQHLEGIHLQRFEEDLKASPIRVESGARGFSEHREVYGPALVVLMAAVAAVILVVCANVANLMLARAVTRMRELTVRMTLGAGRGRLVQQLLTESLLLALFAGILGLTVAVWGSHLLLAVLHGDPPITLDVTPNGDILGFTAMATLACVVLFGLLPAFRVTRVDLATALRGHGRSVGAAGWRAGRAPLATLLVVGQIALSTTLLIGSALLVRSMKQLLHIDLGLDRDHIVAAHVATSRTNYVGPRFLAFQREAIERVRRLPGIEGASYSLGGLFSGGHSSGHVTIAGFVAQADSEGEVLYDYVGPGYFQSIGAHIIRGRDFVASDMDAGANAAAIDATMAKYYFRDRDPMGRTVVMDSVRYTIIGVVADVQYSDVRARPGRRLYIPDNDTTSRPRSFELQVRVRGEPTRYVESIRRAVGTLDRTVPVEVAPLVDRIRSSVSEEVLLTQVTALFGGIALLLAALGLYGVTAYSSRQRTSEFGLRAALGAESWRVAGMVLRQALVVALSGIAIGIPVGLAATRLLRGALFGVSSLDPVSLGTAVVTLVLATLVASYLPAWRASRASPLEALRTDR
jgi:predicted permease